MYWTSVVYLSQSMQNNQISLFMSNLIELDLFLLLTRWTHTCWSSTQLDHQSDQYNTYFWQINDWPLCLKTKFAYLLLSLANCRLSLNDENEIFWSNPNDQDQRWIIKETMALFFLVNLVHLFEGTIMINSRTDSFLLFWLLNSDDE